MVDVNRELGNTTLDKLRETGKKSLFFLARAILGFHDLDAKIHLPICSELQNYKKHPKTIIVLPRDWFKSTLGSIAYPVWRVINNPNIRALIT